MPQILTQERIFQQECSGRKTTLRQSLLEKLELQLPGDIVKHSEQREAKVQTIEKVYYQIM